MRRRPLDRIRLCVIAGRSGFNANRKMGARGMSLLLRLTLHKDDLFPFGTLVGFKIFLFLSGVSLDPFINLHRFVDEMSRVWGHVHGFTGSYPSGRRSTKSFTAPESSS